MPPTLDLSGTTTHKMMVAPPRFNLRRTVSYTHERERDRDRGPLSSTSSRFGFEHLIFASPPPSPGLPQLLPPPAHRSRGRGRGRLPARTPRPSRIIRVLLCAAGLILVAYAAFCAMRELVGSSSRGRGGSSRSSGSAAKATSEHSVTRVSGGSDDGLRYHWPATQRLRAGSTPHDTYDELVGSNNLPDHPTPVLVRDSRSGNQHRWTVSIPPNHRFPLTADEYVDLCAKCAVIAERAAALQGDGGSSTSWIWSWGGRWLGAAKKTAVSRTRSTIRTAERDRNFVDVHEAEVAGFLSGSVSIGTLLQQQAEEEGQLVGEGSASASSSSFGDRPVCGRSLTFALASSDAGLGQTLMLLWIAYAQAQEEGRGFFIDDTRWQYGRYTDLFAPPPSPGCRPPLRHEMLPCPRSARHLVLTLDTARDFFFPGSYSVPYEEGSGEEEDMIVRAAAQPQSTEAAAAEAAAEEAAEADRNAQLFDLARRGYEALFRLTDEDARHMAGRVKQLRAKAAAAAALQAGDESNGETDTDGDEERRSSTIVGVHVRRGDRRPVEFQYRDSYMPLNLYTDQAYAAMAAQQAAKAKKNKKKSKPPQGLSSASGGLLVLASDDPTVYEADEVAGAARAQEHIRLAGKTGGSGGAAAQDDVSRGEFHKFVDETFGWEGGFFASMFWNLGRPAAQTLSSLPPSSSSSSSAPASQPPPPPSPETLRVRSLVGRAYVLDLAVLARASDAVVCAVSATGCRLLAVMLGREAALVQGRWINIDGASGWWAVDF